MLPWDAAGRGRSSRGFRLAAFGAQLGTVGGVRVHLATVGGCSGVFGVQLCLMGNIREQLGNIGDVTFCHLSPQVQFCRIWGTAFQYF